ncbi:hypothetical protein GGR53DRAFT_472162 [Hypoxylon sp. FL1150]|nr:hypothetical protein GGR53DRAFT_472162 [Hypoxylon sp. FL1150]
MYALTFALICMAAPVVPGAPVRSIFNKGSEFAGLQTRQDPEPAAGTYLDPATIGGISTVPVNALLGRPLSFMPGG